MASNPFLEGALKVLREVAARALNRATRPAKRRTKRTQSATKRSTHTAAQPRTPSKPAKTAHHSGATSYPGDYLSRPRIAYDPHPDGNPDPGEIVWTWVPYEEDHREGKDRPVLLIGHDDQWLLGLQVTSQDHDRDADQEARAGRYWVNIGSGAWDAQHRPSEVRVNRIVRIAPDQIRRIGAVLARDRFDAVIRELARHY